MFTKKKQFQICYTTNTNNHQIKLQLLEVYVSNFSYFGLGNLSKKLQNKGTNFVFPTPHNKFRSKQKLHAC